MGWHCGAHQCPTHSDPEHRCRNWRLPRLGGSVGKGGRNRSEDIKRIQGALNRLDPRCGGPSPRLQTTGSVTPALLAAIVRFQRQVFGALTPDGRVDVGGRSFRVLAEKFEYRRVEVSLATQTAYLVSNGCIVHAFEAVTGDDDHPTDKGVFRILRKHHPYRSKTYDVQMDYAAFFTRDGKAFHQYHGVASISFLRRMKRRVSDWIGSRGCVRLEKSHARKLYNWVSIGTRVTVR